LAKFPKAFGLKGVGNGKEYFPYRFLTLETLNYRGKLPPQADFCPESMDAERKAGFDRFYAEKSVSGEIYDLNADLLHYARQDCTILRLGACAFQDMFKLVSTSPTLAPRGIDPFEKSITLGSLFGLLA